MDKTVVELFAGVGGFRVGLERLEEENITWKTVMADQWEPGKKNQFAYDCYHNHFKNTSSVNLNTDISKVESKDIPNHTLLVGGFPCQDYSVASTGAKGIEGKKGVLWWEIYRIAKDKQPSFILLENVDRLLKSPTSQRGRDFAIMLKCLDDLDYNVEWRVINAADYGYSQRRRRVFIFAYKHQSVENTKYDFSNIDITTYDQNEMKEFVQKRGFFNNVFKANVDPKKVKFTKHYNLRDTSSEYYSGNFENDIQHISDNYSNMFRTSGAMINSQIISYDTIPCDDYTPISLESILETGIIAEEYFLNENQIERMKIAKGGKTIERTSADGFKYNYSEGAMSFPENTELPGRTMLTSEGTINRSTHVVLDLSTKKLRFITPVEAERLNGFPDNWTEGMTKRQRFFCMGNALVTNLITEMGREISNIIDEHSKNND